MKKILYIIIIIYNMSEIKPMLKSNKGQKPIDRSEHITKKDQYTNLSSQLVDRQFTLFGNESKMNISKPNNNNKNNELDQFLSSTELKLTEKDRDLYDKFNLNNSSKKKNLDFSFYQGPGKKANGQGFGIPEHYHKTYLGMDSRMNNLNNPRSIDFLDRGMIPQSGFMINYSKVPYDKDSRLGVSTRTYKKMETKFE
jgi:hypothetical protein